MIDYSLASEELNDEGDLYHCNTCDTKVPSAIKTLQIQKAPINLLVTINRFYFDRVMKKKGKLMDHVHITNLI